MSRRTKPMTGLQIARLVETLSADSQTLVHRMISAALLDQQAGKRGLINFVKANGGKDSDGLKLWLDEHYPVQ